MEDQKIIDLYWNRSEQAIQETADRYGSYCYAIAYHILASQQDAEESVSDTYLAAWNAIPPQRPNKLSAFLGKITRYISLDRWKHRTRAKRGGGETALCLDELEECVSGSETPEDSVLRKELLEKLNAFLAELSPIQRQVFVCRYWYLESSEEIGKRFGFSPAKVRSMLHRIRGNLGKYLEQEGLQ